MKTTRQPPKRWFPKTGDLVLIPYEGSDRPLLGGARPRASYGVVVGEDSRDFPGVWWFIFTEGTLITLHIHVIQPLLDLQGKWLKVM